MQKQLFLQNAVITTAALLLSREGFSVTGHGFPAGQRIFTSQAVEQCIKKFQASVSNPEPGWLFENCFPNTLDTMVDFNKVDGRQNGPGMVSGSF